MKVLFRVLSLFFVLFAILCILPTAAMAKSYSASGDGPTERAAIQDAFRKILETAQGVNVESDSYLTNSTIDRDRIHSYTNGHIESYTLLDSHFNGISYAVEVQAEVASGPGTSAMQAQKPSDHLGISDLTIGLRISTGTNRSALNRMENGQTIEASMSNYLMSAGFSHIFGDSALTTGTFDYIISGNLISRDMPMNLATRIPLYTNQAILNIKVTRCDTGENLLIGEYLGCKIDISKQNAETEARSAASRKAAEAIAAVLRNSAVTTQKNYTLTVHNAKNFEASLLCVGRKAIR